LEAARLFGIDPRWRALTEKRDQEDLFHDYLKEVERVEREQQRLDRKVTTQHLHRDAGLDYEGLVTSPSTGPAGENGRGDGHLEAQRGGWANPWGITSFPLRVTLPLAIQITEDTKWKECKELLGEEEEWKELEALDQIAVFECFIRDIEREAEDARRKSRAEASRLPLPRACRAFPEARGPPPGPGLANDACLAGAHCAPEDSGRFQRNPHPGRLLWIPHCFPRCWPHPDCP
jgi:hypothetical protein